MSSGCPRLDSADHCRLSSESRCWALTRASITSSQPETRQLRYSLLAGANEQQNADAAEPRSEAPAHLFERSTIRWQVTAAWHTSGPEKLKLGQLITPSSP